MDKVCNYKDCTGCGLCASQCPKKCISMEPDSEFGHLYPKIDYSTCIDCGLCQKNCPALHPVEQRYPVTAYAAWSKDDADYRSSTSGGAASVLSRHVLSQGGVVYGCAMLPDIDVRHIRIDHVDDLNKLKGSKYVQSSVSEIYPQLRNDVREGRLTLFTGTPCQVAAVRNMFKEQPDNLILVDLICHGVPSLHMLKQHVKNVANYPHYDKVLFREGNGIYKVVVVVDGKEVYRRYFNRPRYKDFYINSFFDGYTFRDSCYHCRYACPNRVSDITIGDFWRLGKNIPADYIPEHPHGVSVMLPSTVKGKELLAAVVSEMNLYERSVEEAVDGNDQLRHPTLLTKRRSLFRKMYSIVGKSAYRIVILDKYLKYNLKRIVKKLINK